MMGFSKGLLTTLFVLAIVIVIVELAEFVSDEIKELEQNNED